MNPNSLLIIQLIVVIVTIIAMWKLFEKAGQPGWWSIIPIWSTLVLMDIVGRSRWWVLLFFIPLVNIIAYILVYVDLAKSFGKDEIWAILLIFYIGFLILAFGDSQYVGPGGRKAKRESYASAY